MNLSTSHPKLPDRFKQNSILEVLNTWRRAEKILETFTGQPTTKFYSYVLFGEETSACRYMCISSAILTVITENSAIFWRYAKILTLSFFIVEYDSATNVVTIHVIFFSWK